MNLHVSTQVEQRSRLAACIVLLCSFGFTACQQQPKQSESTPGKRYTLTGTVLSLDAKDHTAKIKGDPIPGWMDAMTMDYPIQGEKAWDNLHPNEAIRATLDVHDTDYKIIDVQPAAGKQ